MDYPAFNPPRWLRNPHVQTIAAAYKPRHWNYGWQNCEPIEFDLCADEGKIRGEASWQPGRRSDCPVLFLLHGLEGSAESHHMIGMGRKAFQAGFHAIRINTRNCGGTEHLTPTLYCSGLSQDVKSIVRRLHDLGFREIYAAAVSLGANILLKFLGEQGDDGPEVIRGAAVLSPPIDLAAGVGKMEEPQNWIYQRYFVSKLIERMRRKIALFPKIADLERVERIRTIREFDDVVTAPHFGFGSAWNYYRLASSGPLLSRIRVPTLIIQSEDDPMIPFEPFLNCGIRTNPALTLLATQYGGHSGFLGAGPAGEQDQDAYWAECRAIQFLAALAQNNSPRSCPHRDKAGAC